MKKATKLLAALLCLCMLTGFLTTTAFATTTLSKIRVTIDEPVAGNRPSRTASLPSTARSTIKDVAWTGKLNEDGTFKAGTKYTVTITLGIKPGSDCVFSSKSINATVNEKAVKNVLWYAEDCVQINYTFTAAASASSVSSSRKAISAIYLTVDKPSTGEMPATTAKLSAGSNGTVNSVVRDIKWSGQMDTDGTFMPRVKYTVTFTMGIKDSSKYYFSDKSNSLTATVNGKNADEVLWYADDHVEVIYTFPALETGSVINKAHITLDAPEVGKIPAKDAHVPSTASTYVKSIRWEGALDANGRFQAGTEYTAYITLAMKDNGRKFSEKTFDAYVNDYLIDEVTRVSDKEIIIPVEFEKTPGAAPEKTPAVVLEKTPDSAPAKSAFTDVAAGAYYAQPVQWAVDKKITSGKTATTFAPGETCSQAQILTFLWRAAGSPEPTGTVEMEGFTGTEYYYKAAAWAAEQDMVGGEFNPSAPCTRAMAVSYMWKQAGSPSAAPSSFTDVPAGADYAQAVAWAVEKGVTGGTTPTTFAPEQTCTRGQIVTFLYRAFANK